MSARSAEPADMLALLRCRGARAFSNSCCSIRALSPDTSAAALQEAGAACASRHVILSRLLARAVFGPKYCCNKSKDSSVLLKPDMYMPARALTLTRCFRAGLFR